RIAVLGDMLELGNEAVRLHAELAAPLVEAGISLVFTVGANMRALHDALPKRMRGAHAGSAVEMAEKVARRLRPGDIVAVKGSFGSRMAEVVKHLLAGTPAVVGVKG
ncbi:MAG TPA: UDP-N-acetylmuramoylalanyl-D-glutamyl-2, 6-diaminopimelate--D-alanyl-D-alanine ligase, partial [Stellaceae bacterium]